MNKEAWESLPDDIKKIFNEEAGMKGSLLQAQAYHDQDQVVKDDFIAQGVPIVSFSLNDMEKWQAAASGVKDTWLKDMAGKGLGEQADKASTRYLELIRQYEGR